VWTKQYCENWSAFAPDFKELEENEEYEEREDEFDIQPAPDPNNTEEDDEVIDVVGVEQSELAHYPDEADDEADLLFLPTRPEPDDDSAVDVAPMDVDGERPNKPKKRKMPSLDPSKPLKRPPI